MPEIEIEEYVRNESGYIHKVDSFDKLTNFFKDEDSKLKEWVGEDVWGNTIAEKIVKHSKNIIALIEIGDYVNGHLIVNEIYGEDDNELYFEIEGGFNKAKYIGEKDIKSIVTKEQFKSIEYKVEVGK